MTTDPQPDPTPERTTWFSISEDGPYSYDREDHALSGLHDDGQLQPGSKYYSQAFERYDPCAAISASDILERADENLTDDGVIEDDSYFQDFSPEAVEALDAPISRWHAEHAPKRTLWISSGRGTTHTVTAEQVAKYHAAEAEFIAQLRGAQPTPESAQQ